VEVFGEYGEVAFRVADAGVVVVRHRDGKRDINLGPLGGEAEAVKEGVVGFVVGAEEEAPLGAATSYHVVAVRENLPRKGHVWVLG
jgi:hypothetical protein